MLENNFSQPNWLTFAILVKQGIHCIECKPVCRYHCLMKNQKIINVSIDLRAIKTSKNKPLLHWVIKMCVDMLILNDKMFFENRQITP